MVEQMNRGNQMRTERVFRDGDIEFSIIKHDPVKTIQDVAEKLGIPPELAVKVMIYEYGEQGKFLVAALRGCDRVDLGELARETNVPQERLSLVPSRNVESV